MLSRTSPRTGETDTERNLDLLDVARQGGNYFSGHLESETYALASFDAALLPAVSQLSQRTG